MSGSVPSTPPPASPSPKVRWAQLALGLIFLIVLSVNFALFLILSERDAEKRNAAQPGMTNSAPAVP